MSSTAASICFEDQLREFVARVARESGVPGVGVAISAGGIKLNAAAGVLALGEPQPMSERARFQIGCVTKLAISAVTLALARAGTLDLDEEIGHRLHELAPTPKGKAITIRHLLSHTSGYQGANMGDPATAYYSSWPKLAELVAESPQLFAPGTVFNYEHADFALLGEIIRRATGRSAIELVRETVLEPLGIRASTIRADHASPDVRVAEHFFDRTTRQFTRLKSIPYCDVWSTSLSDLTLTLADLAKMARALMGRGQAVYADRDLLCRQVIPLPATSGSAQRERLPLSFGLGAAAYPTGLLGRNGSARGQTCGVRVDVERNLCVAVGLSAWHPYLRDSMLETLFQWLRGAVPAERDEVAIVSDEDLPELAGTYLGAVRGAEARVTLDGGRLECELSNRLQPRGQQFGVVLDRHADGRLIVDGDAQHFSFGFFREPTAGDWCLMVGLNAYRRVAQA